MFETLCSILLICSIYLQAIKKWDNKYGKIKPNKTKDEQCFINKPSIAFTNPYGAPNASLLLTRAFFHLFYYCFVGLNGNRSVVSFSSFRSFSLLKLSVGYYFKRIILATWIHSIFTPSKNYIFLSPFVNRAKDRCARGCWRCVYRNGFLAY